MVPNQLIISTGINLSHWLSQVPSSWKMIRDTFITQKDIQQIAKFGFDHVRIPVDEVQLWDEKGNKEREAFEYVDPFFQYLGKFQGLSAYSSLFYDEEELQDFMRRRDKKPWLWQY